MKENILYPSRDPKSYMHQNQDRKHTFKFSLYTLMALLAISAFSIAHAQDGTTLHAENCIACHAAMTGGEGSVLYTRDDRNVKSSEALSKQVNRCQSSLGLNWSKEQINAVQQYLNKSFYHF